MDNQLYPTPAACATAQHETDGMAAFTWVHTFNANTVLRSLALLPLQQHQLSSRTRTTFPSPQPRIAASNYAGAQASITTNIARNNLQAGIYGCGQHDSDLFGVDLQRRQRHQLPHTRRLLPAA